MSSSSRENTGEQDDADSQHPPNHKEAKDEKDQVQEGTDGKTEDGDDDDDEGKDGDKSSEEEGEDNDGDDEDANAPAPLVPSMQSPYPYFYPQQPSYPPPNMPHGYPPMYPTHPPQQAYAAEPPTAADGSSSTSPSDGRRNRGGVTEPFPEKLHRMLDACEREGLVDVVSFFPHGRAFAIHKPRRFVAEVMPRFFRQTKLTSFQRQLNLYGFQRISQGPDNGGYWHDLFLKGHPAAVTNMKRVKIKGSDKSRTDPESEPNFYTYPPLKSAQPPAQAAPAQNYPSAPLYGYPPPMYPPYGYPYMGYPSAPSPFSQQPPGSAEKKGSPQAPSSSVASPAPQPGPSHPPNFSSPYGYPPPYGYIPSYPHHHPPYAIPPAPHPSNRKHMVQTSPVQVSTANGKARLKPSASDIHNGSEAKEEDTGSEGSERDVISAEV